jgi:4-amino-4-deoxy-L-arabinose transferase-like glycosyltransferase
VKQLADTGRLPKAAGTLPLEEETALYDLHQPQASESPPTKTITSKAQQAELQSDLKHGFPTSVGNESAGVATSEPPLFYALQTIPYMLASGGTLLDQLQLMRLLAALMGGLTALFSFLFLRECLPREPWAWIVGGLAVALAPLLAFTSGSVTPDAQLIAVSAAAFYCLARAFRRGLTRRSAIVLGAVTAIGFMTKLNFVGLAPGVLLGLAVLSVRAARTQGFAAYRSLAAALAVALSPVAIFLCIHLASGHPALGIVSSAIDATHGSLPKELSYIWQLYLPRLPGMHNDFFGIATWRQIWFYGYVGLFGWLDTSFPGWVYALALIPAGLILVLATAGLLQRRTCLRGRLAEILVYAAIAVGLMVLVGADSFLNYPRLDAEYGQTRYLLPLIPILAAMTGLAARGAGRRWGPAVGALLVMLFLAHDVLSQLQTIARFYG